MLILIFSIYIYFSSLTLMTSSGLSVRNWRHWMTNLSYSFSVFFRTQQFSKITRGDLRQASRTGPAYWKHNASVKSATCIEKSPRFCLLRITDNKHQSQTYRVHNTKTIQRWNHYRFFFVFFIFTLRPDAVLLRLARIRRAPDSYSHSCWVARNFKAPGGILRRYIISAASG